MSSQDGYTLQLGERSLPAGPQISVDFRILGPDGRPVTAYQVAHDKELHLIVVRRDLTGFPARAPVPGRGRHLGRAVGPVRGRRVPGVRRLHPGRARRRSPWAPISPSPVPSHPFRCPAPSRTAQVDGYTVTLAGDLIAGQSSQLTLSVSRDGAPVTDLQPYLAAYGHLVALRDGDLAYLHVHPAGDPGDGVTPAGPGITFSATIPSAGDYGLFLDFQHDGVVRTAAFIAHADPGSTAANSQPGTRPGRATATGTDKPLHRTRNPFRRTAVEENMMTTSTYAVAGMTCAHCVAAVTEEVSALAGVSAVDIDLHAGGDFPGDGDQHRPAAAGRGAGRGRRGRVHPHRVSPALFTAIPVATRA